MDSNIIAYLYLGDENRSAACTLARLDEDWAAPVLWRSELRNILAGHLRRGGIEAEDARAIQLEAESLMATGEFEVDSSVILDLVGRSDCSAYDCECVALAKQLGVRLVTADRKVLRAFPEWAMSLDAAISGSPAAPAAAWVRPVSDDGPGARPPA